MVSSVKRMLDCRRGGPGRGRLVGDSGLLGTSIEVVKEVGAVASMGFGVSIIAARVLVPQIPVDSDPCCPALHDCSAIVILRPSPGNDAGGTLCCNSSI